MTSFTVEPSEFGDPANPTPWISEFPEQNNTDDKHPATTQQQLIRELLYDDPATSSHKLQKPKGYSSTRRIPMGLEALHAANSTLVVLRRPENSIRLVPEQRLLAFAQYDIVNEDGHQIYIAVEETSAKSLKWTRDARTFTVTMYDQRCQKVLTISRSCSLPFCCAQYYCLCCLFGFKGCGNEATVTLCDGDTYLGRIVQEFNCGEMGLKIFDHIGKEIMNISGKLIDGVFDVFVPEDDDDFLAMIETSMTVQEVSAFYKIQVSSYEDPYGLTFLSMTLSAKHKALIIAAIILMDYIFLKPSTDYPHWTQLIPHDFKPEDQTREKMFTDGSKEIIITSTKPKINWINLVRQQRRCGCCRWFISNICIYCSLGFVRNGLRCVQLGVFLCLAFAVVVFLCVYFIKKS